MTHTPAPDLTLVFDWGNTLMQEIDGCSGPMVDWPQVAAVTGAREALQHLDGRYRMVVATNAQASNARQVRAALERVGLAHPIESIFTAAELNGNRKPGLGFFRELEHNLHIHPEHAVMIGDKFDDDVLGAKNAGWRSIWLNPQRSPAPGLTPPHDAQIASMTDLPHALETTLRLPTLTQAENWLLEQGNPYNILQHVRSVAALAYLFALWLQAAGQTVDPILAHRGGMLHDVCKIPDPNANPALDHGERGARLLEARGLPGLAQIVRRHMLSGILDGDAPQSWEEKLVYFCDKLVHGSTIVSPIERLDDLQQRYRIDNPNFPHIQAAVLALQDELCAAAGFPSAELLPRLRAAFSGRLAQQG